MITRRRQNKRGNDIAKSKREEADFKSEKKVKPVRTSDDLLSIVKEHVLSLQAWATILRTDVQELRKRLKSIFLFSQTKSNRISEVEELLSRGEEIFGDKVRFKAWLEKRRSTLSNKRPKDLLQTRSGIREVAEELGRIEHGVF